MSAATQETAGNGMLVSKIPVCDSLESELGEDLGIPAIRDIFLPGGQDGTDTDVCAFNSSI